ncbi:ceramidase domain-containing protein [Pseudooctadecabacter sp.]|uniref:ceramidase domain-containing protein n=1 Tax=Pseudooctadecabacter sp. TaxID=1966338 RepID=UPI0025F4A99B|nr:ceramidase domain-containing protein [Pseudooctadecabacter sp.]
MNWFEQFDGYCERTDFTYWSEPLNALTNASFIIAAILMWTRVAHLFWGRVLCAVLFAIGVGSYLFHTHATAWAALADVAPIGIFILVYLFVVNRHMVGWPLWASMIGVLGFLPFAAGITLALDPVPFFGTSNFYWSVPILLLAYAALYRRQMPHTARGFVIGAAILSLSITLRSLDMPLCDAFPVGTHIFWHILNGIMLGWMIEVYRRHMVEAPPASA